MLRMINSSSLINVCRQRERTRCAAAAGCENWCSTHGYRGRRRRGTFVPHDRNYAENLTNETEVGKGNEGSRERRRDIHHTPQNRDTHPAPTRRQQALAPVTQEVEHLSGPNRDSRANSRMCTQEQQFRVPKYQNTRGHRNPKPCELSAEFSWSRWGGWMFVVNVRSTTFGRLELEEDSQIFWRLSRCN